MSEQIPPYEGPITPTGPDVVGTFNVAWADENGPYISCNNGSYTVKTTFRGKGNASAPSVIRVIAACDGSNGAIRIRDATNNNIIAEKTDISNSELELMEMGTISNYPTADAIFEIQMKKGTGGGAKKTKISALSMEWT